MLYQEFLSQTHGSQESLKDLLDNFFERRAAIPKIGLVCTCDFLSLCASAQLNVSCTGARTEARNLARLWRQADLNLHSDQHPTSISRRNGGQAGGPRSFCGA